MICAFDKEKLTGYFDGELEPAEKAEVEGHIASCSECLRELGELKSAALLVKDLPRLRAPRSIAEGVSREIEAAGKARFRLRLRRNLLWTAAAAAGLLVALNIVYFGRLGVGQPASAPASSETVARVAPPKQDEAPDPAPTAGERRSELQDGVPHRALDKSRDGATEGQRLRETPKAKEQPGKAELAPPQRLAAGPAPSPQAAAPAVPPPVAPARQVAAAPASPKAPPAPPGAILGKNEAKPGDTRGEKSADRKQEAEAAAGKGTEEPRRKSILAAEVAPGPEMLHLTLASTQLSKARGQMEECLKKLGLVPAAPSPANKAMKGASRDNETTITLELTEPQLARLRQEVERPGTSAIVPGKPEDPLVLRQFSGRGGIFGGGRKDAASAPAAPAAKRAPEPPRPEPRSESKESEKEPKEQEESARVPPAELAADKAGEPRRKVVIHLVEVVSLPEAVPAGDPVKK